jgi:hypothetical protein
MRLIRSSWLGLLVTLASGGTLAVGVAAEPAKPEPAPSGLAAVQAEFQQLGTDEKIKINQPKLALPQLGGPSSGYDDMPYAGPSIRQQSRNETKGAARDPNWLVNAVMKERRNDDRTSDEKEAEADEADKQLDPMEKLIAEQLRGSRDSEVTTAQKSTADVELSAKVANPLTSFMNGWISERDHDLLLGNINRSSDPSALNQFSNPDSLAGFGVKNGPPGNFGTTIGAVPLDVNNREQNPYLDLAIPGEPQFAHTSALYLDPPQKLEAPSAPKPMRFEASPKPVPRNAELAPPGLSKPEEDARYFPQLKRF